MKEKTGKCLEDCRRRGGPPEAYELQHELRRRRALVFAKSQKRKGKLSKGVFYKGRFLEKKIGSCCLFFDLY